MSRGPDKRDHDDGLTDQQARFVEEYLVDLNATQAATRAGYAPDTAAQQGNRLLNHVHVKAAIEVAIKARADRTAITADRVLQELACLAFSNMAHYVVWGAGSVALVESAMLPEAAQRAVASVEKKEHQHGTNVSFKLHDKTAALVKLGEHLGLFGKDRVAAVDPEEIKNLSDEELEQQCRQFKLIA